MRVKQIQLWSSLWIPELIQALYLPWEEGTCAQDKGFSEEVETEIRISHAASTPT